MDTAIPVTLSCCCVVYTVIAGYFLFTRATNKVNKAGALILISYFLLVLGFVIFNILTA